MCAGQACIIATGTISAVERRSILKIARESSNTKSRGKAGNRLNRSSSIRAITNVEANRLRFCDSRIVDGSSEIFGGFKDGARFRLAILSYDEDRDRLDFPREYRERGSGDLDIFTGCA